MTTKHLQWNDAIDVHDKRTSTICGQVIELIIFLIKTRETQDYTRVDLDQWAMRKCILDVIHQYGVNQAKADIILQDINLYWDVHQDSANRKTYDCKHNKAEIMEHIDSCIRFDHKQLMPWIVSEIRAARNQLTKY